MTRNSTASFPLITSLSAAALALVVIGVWPLNVAKAQVIERGVQGGVVGAIIGGIVGGGRGAGRGAAIGAGVGVIAGAAEADANARAAYESEYYGPPPGAPGYGAPPPGGPGLVYSIQASLTRLGYDPGPVDGVYGARTADAISQFQYANQLPVDGRPSPQLLNLMISQGG